MSLPIAATVFALVFVAELPDKTALASLMLGVRYPWWWVFSGVAAAFAVHVVLAVAAGSLLALLPHRVLQGIVAGVFALGAVLLVLHGGGGEEDGSADGKERTTFVRVAALSFGVILVAEFGDLTQIVTAGLAAKYHSPLSVGVGAALGLWATALTAIFGGRGLLRVVPLVWVSRVAALAMAVLAVLSVVSAVRGP